MTRIIFTGENLPFHRPRNEQIMCFHLVLLFCSPVPHSYFHCYKELVIIILYQSKCIWNKNKFAYSGIMCAQIWYYTIQLNSVHILLRFFTKVFVIVAHLALRYCGCFTLSLLLCFACFVMMTKSLAAVICNKLI